MRKTLRTVGLTVLVALMSNLSMAQCPVSITPTDTTEICSGSSITFYATADPGSTYQWYRNNVLLPLATADTFATATHGSYYCLVTNGTCTSASNSAVINVINATTPTVSNNSPLTFCPPGYVVLEANMDPGITYQWENNSVPIPGATSSSYTVTLPGLYRALETVGGCSKYTPKTAVSLATSVTGVITSDAVSIPCTGGTVNFAVDNAIPGYSYQWQLNGVDIPGATLTTYSSSVTGIYTCVVTASCGTNVSNAIKITEDALNAAITPAGPLDICSGTSVTLYATQGAGYTYEWYRNGVLLPTATADTFETSTQGLYYVIITSGTCTGTSNSVDINVLNATTPTLSYNTPLSFCPPGYVVLIANNDPGLTYQWEKNSVAIPGATSSTYTATTPGLYRALETLDGCSKYTPKLNVSLASSVSAAITATATVVSCAGPDVVLKVSNAIPGYGYQWFQDGISITGANDTTYATSVAGNYYCEVTASCGSATSNTITLIPGEIDAAITPSGNVAICAGSTIVLTAVPSTGATYQWQESGVDITGATNSTLSVSIPGSYTVIISAPCGIGSSAPTVISYGTIVAQITPAGTTQVCSGTSQTFTAVTGTGYSYQWYRNNLLIPVTTSSYTTATKGSYNVVVSLNGVCSETSNTVKLKVINNPTPVITASGPLNICNGDSVTFSTNTYTGVTYQWQKNGIDIVGETNQTYTALVAGTYRVEQTATGCSKYTPKLKVTVVTCRKDGTDNADISEEIVVGDMQVFPNPFADKVNINITTSQNEQIEIRIVDVLGKEQHKQFITSNTPTEINTQLPSGVYIITAVVNGELKTMRVMRAK